MNIGQLGKASAGVYSGLKANIITPKTELTATGEIKGAIFTNGYIELGWIFRNGYATPKSYYKYYDADEDAAPPDPDFVEVLVR